MNTIFSIQICIINKYKFVGKTTSLKERNKVIYIKLKGSIVIGFSPC